MLCLKVLLTKFLINFKVESLGSYQDLQLKADLAVRSMNGYKIKLRKL